VIYGMSHAWCWSLFLVVGVWQGRGEGLTSIKGLLSVWIYEPV